MKPTEIARFFQDCIVRDECGVGMNVDTLYGLYISWCVLNSKDPVSDHAFRAALRAEGLCPKKQGRNEIIPGLSMTGPAATDYILNSRPSLMTTPTRILLPCDHAGPEAGIP